MKKQIITNWFVEPCDAHTNDVIASNLRDLNEVDENVDIEDDKGVSHSVYQVKHSFITRLYKDKMKFSLKFKVYYRKGKDSPLRLLKFEDEKKKKKNQNKK